MLLKRLYHSASYARSALYSAFGSPGFGITWLVVTFFSGLVYLIYNEHKRRNNGRELASSGTASTHGDASNVIP